MTYDIPSDLPHLTPGDLDTLIHRLKRRFGDDEIGTRRAKEWLEKADPEELRERPIDLIKSGIVGLERVLSWLTHGPR